MGETVAVSETSTLHFSKYSVWSFVRTWGRLLRYNHIKQSVRGTYLPEACRQCESMCVAGEIVVRIFATLCVGTDNVNLSGVQLYSPWRDEYRGRSGLSESGTYSTSTAPASHPLSLSAFYAFVAGVMCGRNANPRRLVTPDIPGFSSARKEDTPPVFLASCRSFVSTSMNRASPAEGELEP
jgi:hypothetical protein